MSENIWQVDMFSDLVGFLKSGSTDYIVLSLITKNTTPDLKSVIKKFIKRKAEIFSNVMFLFYTVQSADVGKINFIKGTLNSYPMMCYIKTSSNEVMTYVEGIDGIEPLDECWNIVEKHFITNLKNHQQNSQQNSQQNKNQISEKSANSFEMQNQGQTFAQVDKLAEQRKIVKKLTYLKEKADEYTLEFMEDCRLRKKEEEKLLKKQQAQNK
jgi:spore coat protein CotF